VEMRGVRSGKDLGSIVSSPANCQNPSRKFEFCSAQFRLCSWPLVAKNTHIWRSRCRAEISI